jgi:hypothetical protein
MKRLIQITAGAMACFCVATVLAEGVGATFVYLRVGMSQDKLYRMLAVLENVDVDAIRAKHEAAKKPEQSEQVSPEDVLRARLVKDLHLDLRETAIDKAILELRALEGKLKTERDRYDELKQGFDERLAELARGATDTSLQEVQRTLEAIAPKQAKEQILQMLDEPDEDAARQAMTDVVTILKAMPLDRRKKIIAEFKSEKEAEQLHDILREIRLGEPEVSLIRDTREKVKGL